MHGFETWNLEFIDKQYQLWKKTPEALPRDWQIFFTGFDLSCDAPPASEEGDCTEDQSLRQTRVEALTYRYRDLGHLLSCLDPLVACPTDHPLLSPDAFGLSADDLERSFYTNLFPGKRQAALRDIIKALKETYCRSIGVEYMHLQDPGERQWLQSQMEPMRNRPNFSAAEKRRILEKLHHCNEFEAFLNKQYPGQTRFSLEGADVVIPVLDFLLSLAAENGCKEVILGMAHRGRLNVQANVLHKSYEDIFCEFEGTYNPADAVGTGDVKYHKGYIADIVTSAGKNLRVALISNPSHLETVDPVVQGCARARQEMRTDDASEHRVIPLLLHGDAAFAGQGVVAEVLNMSQLEGYRTGGTLHIVINNQIGYTTLPEDARSTRYSTDVAKMLMVPIFHVHGENPEAALHVIRIACDYRMRFAKDVVVDIVCFRRYGHNEGDEPYFTQPGMYDRIKDRSPLARIYEAQLLQDGIIRREEIDAVTSGIAQCLDLGHQSAKKATCQLPPALFFENWDTYHGRFSHGPIPTGVKMKQLVLLSEKVNAVPPDFAVHPKLQRVMDRRKDILAAKDGVDWAFAETLAFASLLTDGVPIRLSGQDCRRGTFSQRHSYLTDIHSGNQFVPLNHLSDTQAPFSCFNSLLSEAGVLGFEYGYALARPECLTLWEAQFGDFINNAQSIVDLYIASGESKWQRLCGLVLLLPHGMEGMGPEHSSARPERFLQLCADENLLVCQPTTPAQYFHLLRRQAKASFRKPLVVLTPKSLMRHPKVVSSFSDMSNSGFQAVLDDPKPSADATHLLFCSGKIFYELLAEREKSAHHNLDIIRIEQLYPFPEAELKKILAKYPNAVSRHWVQDEPENMGAWFFIRHRLQAIVNDKVGYIGRKPSPSPATGLPPVYRKEQAAILKAVTNLGR
ncbi:MAG: 2-oxoglutarate dehydrogenase E1 component [Desulfobacterales bacterium]|jgi:2-oxoglutarate dehydrogenase E1 component|nr:2-oxoglutarate dehydrogenase E1 component [Desulfobacterales bacterium]